MGFATPLQYFTWDWNPRLGVGNIISVVLVGLYMSRGRKFSGKPTVKQLQTDLKELRIEFGSFANAAATDIIKLNHLVFGMLDEQGKITKITCVNCKEEAIRPDIEGIENSEDCPNCGRNLHKTEQINLQDMQNAILEVKPSENGEDSEE